MVKKMFGTTLPPSFTLKYLDEDEDQISITTDMELTEALAIGAKQISRILRIFVVCM